MRAGQLRQRITLQQLGTRLDDGYGGGSIPFTDIATVWASVEPLTGAELFEARRFNPKLSHKVGIRYYAGLDPRWRVKYGTRFFNIQTVIDPEERHIEMELQCEEFLP